MVCDHRICIIRSSHITICRWFNFSRRDGNVVWLGVWAGRRTANLNLLTKRQLQRLLPDGGVIGCRVTFYPERPSSPIARPSVEARTLR